MCTFSKLTLLQCCGSYLNWHNYTYLSEKETGQEYAAKIIDLSDSSDSEIHASTKREVQILRMVAGHPYISKKLITDQ